MRERKEAVMETSAQPSEAQTAPEPMDVDSNISPSKDISSRSSSTDSKDQKFDKVGKEEAHEEKEMKFEGDIKEDEVHCYCDKGRIIGGLEFQCALCLKYYHAECVNVHLGKCVPFMTNYQFFCKRCNHGSANGSEVFNKKQASFSQMCHTAVGNLMHNAKCPGKFFSKDQDIIPYITENWEALTTMPRRTKVTWHATIAKIMMKDSDIFKYEEDETDPHFCLVNSDLSKIGPNYEAFFKATNVLSAKSSDYRLGLTGGADAKRANKRRATDSVGIATTKQKRGAAQTSVERLNDALNHAKLVPHGYPSEHPFNKDGYRYILAEPDPHAPNRQAFDESTEWAGKPIPGYLYRKWLSKKVLLALHDRAPQLKISEDRLTVTGEKGYSMVRATHGINCGGWYYEVTISDMPHDTATRLGWSQALGNLQAPCGYDKFSYSWRSRKGTRFHQSRGKHYSDEGYKTGDILGFYIYLPPPDDIEDVLPPPVKDKPLVKFKSHLYFEEKDMVADTIKNLKPLKGSKIVMYKNGVSQGEAWTDIPKGSYYPCFSLYKHASITANFGPTFKHPPKDQKGFKPMLDAANESMITTILSDMLYIVENDGQLPEFV